MLIQRPGSPKLHPLPGFICTPSRPLPVVVRTSADRHDALLLNGPRPPPPSPSPPPSLLLSAYFVRQDYKQPASLCGTPLCGITASRRPLFAWVRPDLQWMAFSLGPDPLGLHAPSDRHTGPPLGPSCFTSRITSPRQAPAHRSPSTRTRWPRPAPFDHYPAPRSTARSPVCRRLITSPPAGRTCPDSDGQDFTTRTPLSRHDGPEWRAQNSRSLPTLRSRARSQ